MQAWLQDLPDEIVTDRLIIRPHRPGDGEGLCAAIVDSLADLRRWPASMGWALDDPSPARSEHFCRACAEAFAERRDFPLLILDRGDGRIVGSSGLHRPDWSVPKMEIGWWGRSTRRRRQHSAVRRRMWEEPPAPGWRAWRSLANLGPPRGAPSPQPIDRPRR